jgi:tetratricopeptide (TPR) repeat protein
MLGLAAGAAIWLFRRGWRIPRRALAYAALLPIAVAAFYFSPAGRPLRSRTRWFIEDPWGGARPTLWRDSLAMGLSRPLLGFGPEVFTAEFPRYQSEALARAYPDFAHESPHNIFLDALVSQGLPGVILLALLLLAGLRTRDPAIAAALTAGIVSQQFTVFTIPTALLTFTTVALALPCFETKPGGDRRIVLALVPVSLALLYCAARYSLADYELARAQSFLQAGDTGSAAAAYGRYTGWRLPGASADLWYSRTLLDLSGSSAAPSLRLQAMTLAGGAALQATTSAEDPFNAWYHAAQLAAARNDVAAAELALRYAIAASPTWFKPHWTLARLLALTGRREEARREAALALRLDAGKHPEVGISLANALGGTPFQK